MITSLKSIYSYFIFIAIVIIILSIIFFLTTRKYSKRKVKLFSLFSSLNNRTIILLSSLILNFTLVSFFAVATKHFNDFILYLIVINNIIIILVSLDISVFFANIIYSTISIFSLKIINLVYNYLSLIYYDRLTFILGIIFVMMIVIYELFITVRLFEIVLNKVKPIGGKKKNAKSRK